MRPCSRSRLLLARTLGGWLALFGCTGCLTLIKPLPALNLSEPGWTVHQGQAVWKLPATGDHDIAGEVLVATRSDGSALVQFIKTPFPILIGQVSTNRWQVQLPPQNRRYAGPGMPPKRLIWLYLPKALTGQPLPRHWKWTNSNGNWCLENPKNGEKIEGFFGS